MTYSVEYKFGTEWRTYSIVKDMYSAKLAAKALRARMKDWDGRLLGKVRIVKEEEK